MGESRSPVFSPGSMEPRREAGPAAMGHPPWGSSMGFTLSTSEMGSTGGASARVHSIGPRPLGGGDQGPSVPLWGPRQAAGFPPTVSASAGEMWQSLTATGYRERIFAYLVRAGKRLSEGRYPNV